MTDTNKSKAVSIAAVLLVALIGVLVWWFGFHDSRDAVAKAQDEFRDLIDSDEGQLATEVDSKLVKELNLPPGAKVRVMKSGEGNIGESLKGLSEEQLKEFAQGMIPDAMEQGRKDAQRILDLPPKEQEKALDEMIDRSIEMKKRFGGRNMGDKSGASVEFGTSKDGNEVEVRKTVTLDGSSSDGERMMLNMTTPEQRATMDEFQKLMEERMRDRGMDPEEGGTMIMMGFESENVIVTE